LNEQTRQLQEEDERKRLFLATLGHELRNPLSVLDNAMQLVAGGTSESQLHPMISSQVDHLKRLVDDLLDVSRITRGSMRLQKKQIDLAAIVHAAAEAVATSARDRQRDLVLSVAKTLPVYGDEVRLQQVVTNLLNNALKYSPKGARVEVSLRRDGGEAVVTVRDEGRGIEPDDLQPIFDAFTQTKPGDGGLGIGLAVVKRLVEMHGGSVEAESSGSHRGSTFTVRLPIGNVDDAAGAASRSSDREASYPRSTRMLIIEDGRDTADSLALLLRAQGAEVRCAYNGAEGIERAKNWKPHVALIDIGLPDMTGYEVARRIKQNRGADTLLVAATGFGDDATEKRVRDSGFAEHLVKPVDREKLYAIVTSHLEASDAADRGKARATRRPRRSTD
jgi:CheY-like chemotaxis protein/two-component sensor histidine kinase